MSYIFQIFNRNVLVFSPVFYRWNISFFKYQFQIVTFLFCTPVFKRCNTSCFSCYFSIIFYTLSLNCNVFALRVIICNTLKKKGCAFWNIGKYTVSLPLNQHCFFYRTWFFIFCWLDPLRQDPVLLFCYGGPCKVYCFRYDLLFLSMLSFSAIHNRRRRICGQRSCVQPSSLAIATP